MKAGRTTLVIAHRLSTIVGADQILVLRRGKISWSAGRTRTARKTGEYAALWRRQTREKVSTKTMLWPTTTPASDTTPVPTRITEM